MKFIGLNAVRDTDRGFFNNLFDFPEINAVGYGERENLADAASVHGVIRERFINQRGIRNNDVLSGRRDDARCANRNHGDPADFAVRRADNVA